MDERPRIYKTGEEAREAVLAGVNKIADVVKTTLGPNGTNALIDRGYRPPRITNDGIFIAESMELSDEIEQTVARQLVEVADRTNKDAGDGTTTAITIAQKILNGTISQLNEGGTFARSQVNVMGMQRDIKESLKKSLILLDKQAKKATDVATLTNVAETSLEQSLEEYAPTIAEMVKKVGDEGYISVIEGFHGEVETEVIEGMQFDGKYAHEFMATTQRKTAEYNDIDVAITNYHIEKSTDIKEFTDKFFQSGKKQLVLMAPKFSYEVLVDLGKLQSAIDPETKKNLGYRILAIKIPVLTSEQIEDVACYTRSVFVDKEKGKTLKGLDVALLGHVDKISVDDDKVVLLGGKGTKEAQERIKKLKEEIKIEKDEMFREKLGVRIASLASAVGIIKVGQQTEAEKGYVKLKIEDAVNATQAALKEGVVEGGGLALKQVAKELGKDDILYEALNAPYNQIQENGAGKIPKTVVDPLKVTKSALTNACSVAGMLLTTNTIIAQRDLPEQGMALKDIANVLEHGNTHSS